MHRIFAPVLALFLAGCTTVESDTSTNYEIPLLRTQIDFQPPDRNERIRLIAREKKIFDAREIILKDKLAGVEAERDIIYEEIADLFPDCKRQRHCLASLAKGGVTRFERYNEVSGRLIAADRQVVEAEADLALWQHRYDLRIRAIYNRYLVYELLRAPEWNSRIQQITVHSLEAFPNRRSLSYRLAELGDPGFVPTLLGDLEFRMMGKPVDEAAVIASFDIRLYPDPLRPGDASRFFVNFLVNTYQLDPQFYEKGFLKEWSRRFTGTEKDLLLNEIYCGIYSIAGDFLAPRLSYSKAKPCAEQRVRMQTLRRDKFDERLSPENWILPVTYTRADGKK